MIEYTDDYLETLRTCPKIIAKAPHRQMVDDGRHKRNDMILQSTDGVHKFKAFFRVHSEFSENFSIGLIYIGEEGNSVDLLRCNGPHGKHIGIAPDDEHFQYHVHMATADNISAGLQAERYAVKAQEYATFIEAVSYFLQKCSIEGGEKYFPNLRVSHDEQLNLFDDNESNEVS